MPATPAAANQTWKAAPSDPPDVSATPQARLLGWDAVENELGARATVGCFGFDLSGYTDELAPIVLGRLEPFAVRAAGGIAPASMQRMPWVVRGYERRQLLEFERADGRPVAAVLSFGFDGELRSCFAVCTPAPGDALAPCKQAVDAASFTTPLTLPPPPSWPQALALSVLGHPREAGLGVVASLILCIAALLLSRGVRARLA